MIHTRSITERHRFGGWAYVFKTAVFWFSLNCILAGYPPTIHSERGLSTNSGGEKRVSAGFSKSPASPPPTSATGRDSSYLGLLEGSMVYLGEQSVTLPFQLKQGAASRQAPADPPTLHLVGADPEQARLDLISAQVDVSLSAMLAWVQVTHTLKYTGREPADLAYVFPEPLDVTLHGIRIYSESLSDPAGDNSPEPGKAWKRVRDVKGSPTLTSNLAWIVPGRRVTVTVTYSERLVRDGGFYQFVYRPLRWNPRLPQSSLPALTDEEEPASSFEFLARLNAAIPIRELTSPSHTLSVHYRSRESAHIRLAEEPGEERDIVIRYKTADRRIQSGALLYRDNDDVYFLLLVEPAENPLEVWIPNREFIFLVDVSESMSGFPLDAAALLLERLVRNLSPSDHFNLILFEGGSGVPISGTSMKASEENIRNALSFLRGPFRKNKEFGLSEALHSALDLPVPEVGAARSVILITDGYIEVKARVFRRIHEHLARVGFFVFGVGNRVHRPLIEYLAQAAYSIPYTAHRADRAHWTAERFRRYVDTPLLADFTAEFSPPGAYDLIPPAVSQLRARTPLVILGKIRGDAANTVRISGRTSEGRYVEMLTFHSWLSHEEHAPLRSFWAVEWFRRLHQQLTLLGRHRELEQALARIQERYGVSFSSSLPPSPPPNEILRIPIAEEDLTS